MTGLASEVTQLLHGVGDEAWGQRAAGSGRRQGVRREIVGRK